MNIYVYKDGKFLKIVTLDTIPNVGEVLEIDGINYEVDFRSPKVDENGRVVYFNVNVK